MKLRVLVAEGFHGNWDPCVLRSDAMESLEGVRYYTLRQSEQV